MYIRGFWHLTDGFQMFLAAQIPLGFPPTPCSVFPAAIGSKVRLVDGVIEIHGPVTAYSC